MLRAVAPITAQKFSGALVMPNTDPPIETIAQAAAYKKEILSALPAGSSFKPLMSFYLTKKLTASEIEKGFSGKDETKVHAVKYYPYGATTNSQWGYHDILEAADVLATMENIGMPLLLHGEVHVNAEGQAEDPYEGERLFLEERLPQLQESYPKLKISLEHLSTAIGAQFMEKHGKEGELVATVTPHHLLYTREDADSQPFLRCKPLIKTREDRDAIRNLVKKGLPFISAGTDSAPHAESKKLSGAFGVFNSPVAIELYTQVFDDIGALDVLEGFLSLYGPRFFGIEPASETITLEKKDWQVTEPVVTNEGIKVWPLYHKEHGLGNETLHWQIQ